MATYLKECCAICDPKKKYNNCICATEWKTFDETMNKIKSVSSEILLEPLRISTITLCFNLNNNIDCDTLIATYKLKNEGRFYNSFIFNWHTKYQYKTLVSVKIFPNGKVQVAGVSNIKSCAYLIRKIFKKVSPFFKYSIELTDDLKLIKIEKDLLNCQPNIVMINSDFKIDSKINLNSFCSEISKYSINNNGNFVSIVYQPIKYPAVNCKFITDKNMQKYLEHNYKIGVKKNFKLTISILIFRSGSIIVTGGNSIVDYLETYNYLLNFLSNNKNNILINK